jgi:hypothetical protein
VADTHIITSSLRVTAPTAAATAVPAALINNLGAENDGLVVEKASTPVFKVGNGGSVTASGAVDTAGALTALNAEIGGGFGGGYAGGSGCSIMATGAVKCDGAVYVRSTLGVTGAVTVTGAADIGGTLNYGANDLYAIGHASSGKSVVAGQATTIAVGSVNVTHGLTSVDSVTVSICQVPTAVIAATNAVITSTTVTLEAWDSVRSSRANGAVLCYMIVGTK